METQNLWPDFPVETTKSPKSILKEQAGYLMAKTNNVLSADVETIQGRDGQIIHHFNLIAPVLNNYHYRILTVSHSVFFYPLNISGNNIGSKADNEEEFINKLSEIFNDPSTIQIVSSLLSQSLAE